LDVSSATVRNELSELEEQGYLTQPHTSAGRIPSEKGWRYYLDNLLPEAKLSSAEQKFLSSELVRAERDGFSPIKALAKGLAELSREAVMVGFGPHDVYYTGLQNLFRQPEFESLEQVCNISAIIDHLDEAMAKVFDQEMKQEVEIFIGQDNPFGQDCSAVCTTIELDKSEPGILGILGPFRLDYSSNIARLKLARSLLTT
jgi:heat-inducible transcriptional repressor